MQIEIMGVAIMPTFSFSLHVYSNNIRPQPGLIALHSSGSSHKEWRIMANNDVVGEKKTISVQNKNNDQKKSGRKGSRGRGFRSPKPKRETVSEGSNDRKTNDPVIRRVPLEKPFAAPEGDPKLQEYEGVFLVSWAGLGILILLEGVVLAASGFLPEEWDKFLVKYLYPAFTPTVVLFLAGTVAYGLYKYFGDGSQKG